jgi:hypothetical protein
MDIRKITTLGLKAIALTVILLLCHVLGSVFLGASVLSPGTDLSSGGGARVQPAVADPPPVDTGAVLPALLVVSLLETVVLTTIILRSRWSGWKLVGAVFLAFYGLNTVVAQIESIVFLQRQLPPGMIHGLFLMGAIVAGLFSPVAVLTLGKMRRGSTSQTENPRLAMRAGEWAWKLAAIAAAYVILYFAFGYFVAWKNPAVRTYYGGSDPGSFFAQMAWIGATTPWMFPLQAGRAMLWTAFTLPVIRMHRGRAWEVGLTVALLFAVWSSQLLLPNPYMPEAVARTHLVETALSNFIFGWVVGGLLSRHPLPPRDLSWRSERLSGGEVST